MVIYAAFLALAWAFGSHSAIFFTVWPVVGYMGWAITHTAERLTILTSAIMWNISIKRISSHS